nr:hypothetical protein [Tanacetum cinerariifolium]
LQVKQKKDGIFISQDKYVAEILKKFGLSEGKSASTPIDAEKPLLKDSDGKDVDVHTYRLISWQCKKQTVVATSSTEAEYVVVASGCAQVLWIQNYDSLLLGVNTPRSDEDRLKLMELMVFLLQKGSMEVLNSYYSTIFERQRTSWNEFSTAMASAVICLSTGQKFNFSKYIFDSLVRNVDSSSKFYMYPRFIQLIIQNQVGDLSTHTTRFVSHALTQKVFANMRRVGKGFLGVETPLFEGMLAVRQPVEEGVAEEQVQADDAVAAAVQENVAEDGVEFPTQIQQVLNVCSALTKRVKNLQNDNVAQKLVIIKLKARVKKLEMANKVKSSKLRRLRKVGASRQVESSDDMEDVFNQGRMIDDMDKDEGTELVKDADIAESEGRHAAAEQAEKQAEIYNLDMDHSSKVLSMQEDDSKVQEVVEVVTNTKLITDVVTAALQVSAASATISAAKPSIPVAALIVVAAYTRRRNGVIIRDPEEELSLKTLAKTTAETPKVKDKGKCIMIETPKPMKKKDPIELDAEYARKLHEEINKDHEEFVQSFKLAQKAAKRRKLSEKAQEAEDLRKCLEVVDDEDNDVFIEATPLARKVPVVDYQIVLIDNKPKFKIIKADETHQLYISFTILLKNFDREDLENLWGIVKDRFSTSKPANFSDEYLLLTLKTMFKKPNGQDAIWRNQKSVHGLALVKS